MQFLEWLQATWMGVFVRESLWGYPTVLSAHAIGMAIVVGMVLMIDIRVLGFAQRIPIAAFDRLFGVAWLGVGLNVLSGIMLFSADAVRFATNRMFQIKIALIIAGAISVWVLLREIMSGPQGEAVISPRAKVVATLSIIFWLGAITAGRLTAYLG
jgi:Family of unknown function (DUF6644)